MNKEDILPETDYLLGRILKLQQEQRWSYENETELQQLCNELKKKVDKENKKDQLIMLLKEKNQKLKDKAKELDFAAIVSKTALETQERENQNLMLEIHQLKRKYNDLQTHKDKMAAMMTRISKENEELEPLRKRCKILEEKQQDLRPVIRRIRDVICVIDNGKNELEDLKSQVDDLAQQ